MPPSSAYHALYSLHFASRLSIWCSFALLFRRVFLICITTVIIGSIGISILTAWGFLVFFCKPSTFPHYKEIFGYFVFFDVFGNRFFSTLRSSKNKYSSSAWSHSFNLFNSCSHFSAAWGFLGISLCATQAAPQQ